MINTDFLNCFVPVPNTFFWNPPRTFHYTSPRALDKILNAFAINLSLATGNPHYIRTRNNLKDRRLARVDRSKFEAIVDIDYGYLLVFYKKSNPQSRTHWQTAL